MKQLSFFGRLWQRCRENSRFGVLLTAALIAVIVVLNTVIFGLANRFSWYFYTEETYEHTIGDGTDAYLAEVADKGTVRILFCDTPESLSGDKVYNLVWQTARQFAARHSFITVENINIFTDPELAEPYKYEIDPATGDYVRDPETGERKQVNAIGRTSVIFAAEGDYAVLPMQSFFVLDDNDLITAYCGEEVTAAMIHRVLTPDTRPNAYFTMSHGETYSTAFMNRLICAGYQMQTVDLVSEEITYRAGDIVVVSNPRYDFIRGNAERGVRGELDKLEEFLAAGGSVYAMLDPLVTNTVKLEEFLTDWGITVDRAATDAAARDTVMVRDPVNSVTTDGYALITAPAGNGTAGEIAAEMEAIGAGRVIISHASPMTLTETAGKTVTALLTASSSAKSYANGKEVNGDGGYTVAAVSRDNAGGGSVFAVSSVYLTAQDAITTNEYGNRDFLFLLLRRLSDVSVPTGGTYLFFEATSLENLTMREARLWTALLAVVLPAAVAVSGAVILLKRRNR